MLRNILTIFVAIGVILFIGSLVLWSIVAMVIAIGFAIAQQWEIAALFGLAGCCWGYSAVFFIGLSRRNDTNVNNPDQIEGTGNALERRVASVFGIVSGTAFGLALGLIPVIFHTLVSAPSFASVGIMFGTICFCTLICYAAPNLGPEILSQLEHSIG